MSCQDERDAMEEAQQAAEAARIEYTLALAKAENATEAALWACLGEIGVGIGGGAATGATAGGVGAIPGAANGGAVGATACLAGLYAARSMVDEAEAAHQELELAEERAGDKLVGFFVCMFRCDLA